MKKLTEQQVEKGVAALDELRERIVPKYFETPVEVFKELMEDYPDATHIRQVLMWDEKKGWLMLANYAEPSDTHAGNDSHPCPPCCPKCPGG